VVVDEVDAADVVERAVVSTEGEEHDEVMTTTARPVISPEALRLRAVITTDSTAGAV
jgi:hypothetical protein